VLNREAVALAVRAGLAMGCEIRPRSRFARKHYFYPDLPKGYQISQFEVAVCEEGVLDVPLPDGGTRRVRIQRAHLEEDAGKNVHGGSGATSLVDLNRAGVPLLEIVGRPDIRSAAEAAEYLRQLRALLMFAGVNDGNLEAGNFRCDANVSVRPRGTEAFGTRVELKNINSFRFVQKALEWEIAAQVATLSAGGRVEQVTKTWDDVAARCNLLRKKEGADDYRYFPDPDLPPLRIDAGFVEEVRATLPEVPQARRRRYVDTLGLTAGDARRGGLFRAARGGLGRRQARCELGLQRAQERGRHRGPRRALPRHRRAARGPLRAPRRRHHLGQARQGRLSRPRRHPPHGR
jgi:aspartyl-tRNA(Asn)/glutamyl-tRNA(Gln) amidotransferase subunit B